MKTIKLVALIGGILFYNIASAFTLFNMPEDEIYKVPADNTFVALENIPEIEISNKEVVNKSASTSEDTIVIDLAEFIVREPFPGSARECIAGQIPYPEFASGKKLEGGVAVQFAFDKDGNIEVRDACSSNKELEKYVCSKITDLHLENCVVDVDKDYYLRFMFKVY
jgi:hypothetical protein